MKNRRSRTARTISTSTAVVLVSSILGSGVAAAETAPAVPTTDQTAAFKVVDSDGDGILDAVDAAAAGAGAKAQREKVEDLSQRTESASVFANPDGTFTRRDFGATVRVKKSGKWTPADYTLVEQSDGSYAPKASDVDITIGGGGTREAARVALDGDESLAFTWPNDLPAPTIAGGVATYKLSEVTDLVVAVTASGVTARIRLNEEPTADDPVFALGLRADSLDLEQTKSTGALLITDGDDKAVGGAQQFLAWDAAVDKVGDPTNVVELDADLEQTRAAGDVTDHTLELTTPDGFLSDRATKYPVTIDPNIRVGRVRDTWVRAGQSTNYGDDYRLIVGKVDPAVSSNSNPARAYMKFFSQAVDTNPNVVVTSATLSLWQYYAYSCTDRRMYAMAAAAPWGDTMTWSNMVGGTGTAVAVDDNRGASGCGQGWTKLNITNMAKAWNTGSINNNGLRLHAGDETLSSFERRFCSMDPVSSESICNTATRSPTLDVTYNTYPYTATQPTATVADQSVTLRSVVADPDGGSVRGRFLLKRGSTTVYDGYSAYVASGSSAQVTVPGLSAGSYTVQAWSNDGSLSSKAASTGRTFTVVAPPSATTPTVDSVAIDVSGTTAHLEAYISGPNDSQLRARFVVRRGATTVLDRYSDSVASDSPATAVLSDLDDGPYTVEVWATDGSATSSQSVEDRFIIDTTLGMAADDMVPLTPTVAVDTRAGVGLAAPLSSEPSEIDLTTGGVPISADSVLTHIRVTDAAESGRLLASTPQSDPMPVVSFDSSAVAGTTALLPVVDGKVTITSSTSGVNVQVSVLGYTQTGMGGAYTSLPWETLYDGTIAADSTESIPVAGSAGVPDDGTAASVLLNLTANDYSAPGGLVISSRSLYETTGTQLSWGAAGTTVTGIGLSELSADGDVVVRNTGTSPVRLKITAKGWFEGASLGDETDPMTPSGDTFVESEVTEDDVPLTPAESNELGEPVADIAEAIAAGEEIPEPSTDAEDGMVTAKGSNVCGEYAGAGPPGGKWATYRWIGCSYAGYRGSSKSYYWYHQPWLNGSACTKVKGFDYRRRTIWRNAGCGRSGGVRVPWGNVIGIPGYKVTSRNILWVATTYWH